MTRMVDKFTSRGNNRKEMIKTGLEVGEMSREDVRKKMRKRVNKNKLHIYLHTILIQV